MTEDHPNRGELEPHEGEIVIDPPPGQDPLPGFSVTMQSGPLPSAAEFAEYGRAQPDAPDRILRMAESTLAHYQEMDRGNAARASKMVDGEIKLALRQQVFTLILALAFLVLSGVAIWQDQTGFGVGSGLAGVATIAWALRPGSSSSPELKSDLDDQE